KGRAPNGQVCVGAAEDESANYRHSQGDHDHDQIGASPSPHRDRPRGSPEVRALAHMRAVTSSSDVYTSKSEVFAVLPITSKARGLPMYIVVIRAMTVKLAENGQSTTALTVL